jgi:TonB family protein
MRRTLPITVVVVFLLLVLPTHGKKKSTTLSEWLPGKHRDDVVQVLGEPSESNDSFLVYELDPDVYHSKVGRSKKLQLTGDESRSISRIEVHFDEADRVSTWDVEYTGPYLAGTDNVTPPVLKQRTKVKPVFPLKARQSMAEGRVILQVVIDKSGTVIEAEVLACNRRGFGFEESAIAAVMQWKYKPATLDREPVDVYFTMRIDFELN